MFEYRYLEKITKTFIMNTQLISPKSDMFLIDLNNMCDYYLRECDFNQMEKNIPDSISNHLMSYEIEMDEIDDFIKDLGALDSYFLN